MEVKPDGWSQFAKQIVDELRAYDRLHKTEYAYFLDTYSVTVLAEIMRKVDKRNYWQPMKGND